VRLSQCVFLTNKAANQLAFFNSAGYRRFSCSGSGTLNIPSEVEQGWIESPNYPNDYGNNQDCTWHITATTVRFALLFNFLLVNIPDLQMSQASSDYFLE